ncbi:vWA domain-containing protein [Thermicanus aegyptius]|uniref:vWA domain-containing protein n=1 Tax=Thermicanus aegyptius TaxID=94009 RepID=UPI0004016449|nr:VWA domain-containing protein [Thermicanus aegyptius]
MKTILNADTSVLNTDAFDRRRFEEIYNMSSKLQQLGKESIPGILLYPLMGDVWASLYKMRPELKQEVNAEVETNKNIIERIMNDESFHDIRKTTRLDDISSAIGTVKYTEKVYEWFNQEKERNQEIQNALKNFQKAYQKQQDEENRRKDQDGKNKRNKKIESLEEALRKAILNSIQSNPSSLQSAFASAAKETKEAKENLKSLFGGINAGNEEAELSRIPLRDQIAVAEKLSKQPKIKKVAEWAGRFKKIAQKKQKAKHTEAIERSGVNLGNEVERLLPMELANYKHARTDFLRRFAEGQTFIYDNKGKEKTGKGPIILCLDQSSSMDGDPDEQAKGFALALASIARKQHRDFAYIPFNTKANIAIYKKGKMTAKDLVDMATSEPVGGTSFEAPLRLAMETINQSRFNKADIVFITDGEAGISEYFINEFLKTKEKKEFKMRSILIRDYVIENISKQMERISDQVDVAKDLLDEKALRVFEI